MKANMPTQCSRQTFIKKTFCYPAVDVHKQIVIFADFQENLPEVRAAD